MTNGSRAISIRQLPEKLDVKRGRLFFRELEDCLAAERPCIVLDCSHVQQMGNDSLHLLLCCLEGAIKRNGDVRLAAVSEAAMGNLEFARIDRLFRIFATVDAAVDSYERRLAYSFPSSARAGTHEDQPASNAA